MKANELRVGNIVKYAKGVYKFAGQETEIGDIIQYETDFYEPIPLTEEWLLKFGFEKQDIHHWFIKKYFTDCEISAEVMAIVINTKTFRCGICDFDNEDGYAITGKGIKHVHQLQNLYFALTGEELTIKTI